MMEAIFGLLGVLLGTILSWFASTRQAKMQNTLDLHREFTSGDILISRNTAGRILAKHLDKPLNTFSNTLSPEDYSHVWNIIHFYQRLWVSIKHEQIMLRMIPSLFGEVFFRWYIPYYESMLVPLNWSSSNNIRELFLWFKHNIDTETYTQWVQLAKGDRQRGKERYFVDESTSVKIQSNEDLLRSLIQDA